MNRLQNKIALVTGGALGLGRAQALLMASEGAKIVVTDVKEADGRDVIEEIKAGNGKAIFLKHDVSDEKNWETVMGQAVEKYGKIDIIVNNAGVAITKNVEETTLEEWRWLMSINLDGVFLGTKFGIQSMKKTGGGSIINLSSILGLVGHPDAAAYNASKGGVRLFTKSAALYCAQMGYDIRVNSVHPGYIWTPMVENYLQTQGDIKSGKKAIDRLQPVGHIGEPDDIAYGVLYLASDESKFVTGTELVIDGGYTAR